MAISNSAECRPFSERESEHVDKGGEGDQTNRVREGGNGQRINREVTEQWPFTYS